MGPNISPDEPDLDHFKMLIRSSAQERDDSLNRSQDFLGNSHSSFAPPRSPIKSPRPGGGGDRPDDWLGTPTGTRKSYTIKGVSTGKPPLGITHHTLGGSSSHHQSGFTTELSPMKKSPIPIGKPSSGIPRHTLGVQPPFGKSEVVSEESQAPPPSDTVPSGLTRHTLGGSSSHHKSSLATDVSSPNPEHYKEMLRASLNVGSTRSQDFLGGSDHGATPRSFHTSFKKPSPKFTSPVSPDRPDEWLGSPASSKHKNYKIKNTIVVSIPNLDDDDEDDSKPSPEIMPSTPNRNPRPIKAQSMALGASPRKVSSPTKSTAVPVKSQSIALGQRPWDASPVLEKERVDRRKFMAAFSAFENSKSDLSPTSSSKHTEGLKGLTAHIPPAFTTSPCPGSKRNFTISSDAKRKTLSLSSNTSPRVDRIEPSDDLQTVLSRLRKVSVSPKDSSGRSHESEWVQRIQQMRRTSCKEYSDMLEDLQRQGLVSCNLGPNRMDQVLQAIGRLEQVRKQNPEVREELTTVIEFHLRKLTPTCAGAPDTIQQAIAKLRKVVLKDPSEVDEVISTLENVLTTMQDGQEAELAHVLSGIENRKESLQKDEEPENNLHDEGRTTPGVESGDAELQELEKSVCEVEMETSEKEIARLAKARFSPYDADYLIKALCTLKKSQLNKRQAARIAGFVRDLKSVQGPEDEKTFDEMLSRLSKHLKNNEKCDHILETLNGLRRIRLNDPERAELAEVVRGLGKGYKYRDEIAEAISKLRKVQMTPSEAKEAAGIMFNLRKVQKKNFNLDNSREMVNLRKVMTAEKADVVASVFLDLSTVDLTEKEMDEMTGAVVELGVEPLGPSDYQLIHVEYKNGTPEMVLNIPAGADYGTQLEELGVGGHVEAKTTNTIGETSFSVILDTDVSPDDEKLDDESENLSVDDKQAEKKERIIIKIKKSSSPSPRPSPIVSPKRAIAKNLHHYGESQTAEQSPIDETNAAKIRFSNKHHWRHKKHNCTVVNEKRWRFEESFNADEVIWSPLSREQYDRRKTVGASILASMNNCAPLDDMVLDEFEEDRERNVK